MTRFLDSPPVGWSAVLSSAVAIVGNVFLILFYIFQAPRMFAGSGNGPDYLGAPMMQLLAFRCYY